MRAEHTATFENVFLSALLHIVESCEDVSNTCFGWQDVTATSLDVGWVCFVLTPGLLAQLDTVELVMKMNISAAWLKSTGPKVPMKKPQKCLVNQSN